MRKKQALCQRSIVAHKIMKLNEFIGYTRVRLDIESSPSCAAAGVQRQTLTFFVSDPRNF